MDATFIAAYEGQVKISQLFLDHDVDVNHRNNNGWTPLSIAAQNINNIVVLLNACSADDEQEKVLFSM